MATAVATPDPIHRTTGRLFHDARGAKRTRGTRAHNWGGGVLCRRLLRGAHGTSGPSGVPDREERVPFDDSGTPPFDRYLMRTIFLTLTPPAESSRAK